MKGNVFLTKDGKIFLEAAHARTRKKTYVDLRTGETEDHAIRPRSWKKFVAGTRLMFESSVFFSNGWMCFMDLPQIDYGRGNYLRLFDAKIYSGSPTKIEYSKFVPFLLLEVNENDKLISPVNISTDYDPEIGYVWKFKNQKIACHENQF